MKNSNPTVVLAFVFAILTCAAGSLFGQAPVIGHLVSGQLVTITAAELRQGGTSNVTGTTVATGTLTSYATPTKVSINTKQILAYLGKANGVDLSTSGAKLLVMSGTGSRPAGSRIDWDVLTSGSNTYFCVVDKNNIALLDVSNILSIKPGKFNTSVLAGILNETTDLAATSLTDQRIVTLVYDDSGTAGGGSLQFSLTGYVKHTVTDKFTNVSTGEYKETQSAKTTSALGDGNSIDANQNYIPMVLTGSFAFSWSGPLIQ